MRVEFAREGLGYVMSAPEIAVELTVPSLVRSRGEWFGELDVACGLPGIRSSDGQLHRARFNFSSSTARATLARDLTARAAVPDLDWREVLEIFCRRVLTEQNQGNPVVTVGNRPARLAPRYLLDPILPAGKATIFYGEGSVGKSTLAAAIAVSVQTGLEVIPGWHPLAGNVLYLDWETDADDLDDKVRAIAAGAGIGDEISLLYRACAGPFAESLEETARLVTEHTIRLLVVDSLGMASGASDGGDAADTAFRLFGAFRALGLTVLALDHVAKADLSAPNQASRPYGSVYKVALARSTFEVRRSEASDTVALYNTKSNLARRLSPIALRIEYDTGRIRYHRAELDESLIAPISKLGKVLWLLKEGALADKEIAERLDISEANVRAIVSNNRKLFVKLGDGRRGLVSHAS